MGYLDVGSALLPLPYLCGVSNNIVTFNDLTQKAATLFHIDANKTCNGMEFHTTTVTTGATFTARLETVNSSGEPTGTLYHANATGTVVVDNTDDNVKKTVSWTGFSVTKGDLVALVLQATSGSPSSCSIRTTSPVQATTFPCKTIWNGSAWARSNTPLAAHLTYDDGSFSKIIGVLSTQVISVASWNEASVPDEWGNKITLPYSCKITGVWVRYGGTLNDHSIKIYDNADNVLSNNSINSNSIQTNSGICFFNIPETLVVSKNDVLRVTILAGASTVTNPYNSSSVIGSFPLGSSIHRTTRADAGSWTDSTSDFMAIGFIISEINEPSGGEVSYAF